MYLSGNERGDPNVKPVPPSWRGCRGIKTRSVEMIVEPAAKTGLTQMVLLSEDVHRPNGAGHAPAKFEHQPHRPNEVVQELEALRQGMDLPPFLTQPVKTQNPFKGELSHGFVAQVVH